jgi:hypothetical protein
MCPQGNPTSTSYFSFYLWDHGVSYFLSYWAAMFFFPFFPFYHISNGNRRKKQTAPSTASGKRKCDDTNSTYEHTNIPQTTKQHNICLQTALVFFASSFFCFLFFYCGMEWQGGGIHRDRREEERSALEVETGQTEGERNQVVTPLALVGSLSRVRPSCWK